MTGRRCVLLLLTGMIKLMTHIVTSHPDCPSDDWMADESKRRCVTLLQYPKDFRSAVETCDVTGSRLMTLESDDDVNTFNKFFGTRVNRGSVWTGYIFMRSSSGYKVFNSQGNEIGVKNCRNCPTIIGQVETLNIAVDSAVCGHLILNRSSQWTFIDCSSKLYVVCQHAIGYNDGQLSTTDIAAIAVGTFILLTFLVTLAIDFCLRLKKERTKYNQNNQRNLDKRPESKTYPDNLSISANNFCSKDGPLMSSLTSSHV